MNPLPAPAKNDTGTVRVITLPCGVVNKDGRVVYKQESIRSTVCGKGLTVIDSDEVYEILTKRPLSALVTIKGYRLSTRRPDMMRFPAGYHCMDEMEVLSRFPCRFFGEVGRAKVEVDVTGDDEIIVYTTNLD